MQQHDPAADWANPPPAADAEQLRNLLAAYAVFTDAGRRAEIAGLFTADAAWDGTELGYGQASGPEAIADVVLSHHDPQRPMFHFAGPPLLVSRSATEVHASSWCVAARSDGGPVIYFEYADVLRRDAAGRWRFASRRLRLRRRS
ncbi:MAG: nuclear transport factor 2 family protein [Streptosporangiaceae bacterium]